ncbi:5-formyltetrahydrofolate cyclo-ligase [Breznakibacter xylanolyticus]|nr:5-formyltetrahydrofolate cyclo-ligase [Breznakibacter xylanolyticus]MBN2742648.1 5-formyltetrahydrofolate cyclo-ligase [Marinilabiliaceae bacterium]
MPDKYSVRKEVRERLQLISKDDRLRKSQAIFETLEQSDDFRNARHVLLYWALPDEVMTHPLVQKWALYKTVYLPVMVGDDLQIRQYHLDDDLRPDARFGVGEPTNGFVPDDELIDLVVVPGRAFDGKGNRLGRGKGYYDRLLARLVNARKIGICFKEQLYDSIPVDDHDVLMDRVISS